MSESYPFSVQSWSDIYQILRAKAEAVRGTSPNTADTATRATSPRTSTQDACAIALVFDQAIDDHASGQIVARWIWESDALAGEPADDERSYAGNGSLWETLAAAAVELDNRKAPLPRRALIEGALRQLAAKPPAAHHQPVPERDPQSGSNAMLVTVFAEATWKAMAIRQLEFFRALRGEIRGGGRLLPVVPSTWNADILALATYWTEQLARIGDEASNTFHRLLYSAWRQVVHQAMRAEEAPPHETYAHNFEFWSAMLLLTTQSDACDATPAPWLFQLPALSDSPRNVAAVDTGSTLDFPSARTWDEAAQMQRDAFAKLRGEDRVVGRLVSRVPRTTVADVRQLAAYWSRGLAKVGERGFADVSSRHVVDRWRAAVAEVGHVPLTTDPSTVYAYNTDFWEAVLTIAIQVAVTDEAPTRWQLAKEATKQAIIELPQTLVNSARDFVNGLTKPLLYAGIGLGGIVLAALVLRRPAPQPESVP